jgi:hypothetical protein
MVEQPLSGRFVFLPDDWDEIAYLVPARAGQSD